MSKLISTTREDMRSLNKSSKYAAAASKANTLITIVLDVAINRKIISWWNVIPWSGF